MEEETVDEGHMNEPNDVSMSSDDDDEVYVCSNKHGTHKPSRINFNPMAAKFWPSSPKLSS
jgi:DNA/RNA endonuclease G (NUC1)